MFGRPAIIGRHMNTYGKDYRLQILGLDYDDDGLPQHVRSLTNEYVSEQCTLLIFSCIIILSYMVTGCLKKNRVSVH